MTAECTYRMNIVAAANAINVDRHPENGGGVGRVELVLGGRDGGR